MTDAARESKFRELSNEELALVAGGWGNYTFGASDLWVFAEYEQEIEVIRYTYVMDRQMYYDDRYYESDPQSGGGGDGGGGSGYAEEPAETPCVEASPSGIPLIDINRAALAATNAIAEKNDETYEYGAILWEYNGLVGWTPPFTQESPDEIDWNEGLAAVPDGARIVGIVHNHPNDVAMDDRIPSPTSQGGQDWLAYDAILNWTNSRNITVDPNMLMYIYTDEDHKTRVYDKTDKNDTHPSCALQQ